MKCSLRCWEEGTPPHTEEEIKKIKEKLQVFTSVKVKVIHWDKKEGSYIVAIKDISRNLRPFEHCA